MFSILPRFKCLLRFRFSTHDHRLSWKANVAFLAGHIQEQSRTPSTAWNDLQSLPAWAPFRLQIEAGMWKASLPWLALVITKACPGAKLMQHCTIKTKNITFISNLIKCGKLQLHSRCPERQMTLSSRELLMTLTMNDIWSTAVTS